MLGGYQEVEIDFVTNNRVQRYFIDTSSFIWTSVSWRFWITSKIGGFSLHQGSEYWLSITSSESNVRSLERRSQGWKRW
jgi:hypothetical protein